MNIQHSGELDALGEGTDDQRAGDTGKCGLECANTISGM
jgi:hypothetical protein